jgi:hypothetical protein
MREMRAEKKRRKIGAEFSLIPALVLLVSLCPSTPAAAQDPPAVPKFGPLQKSLLVPGWGQISEGRIFKGAAFLAAELACLAGAFHQNGLGNTNYDLYQTATDAESASRYRGLVERHDGRRNAFLLAGAAVWAVNLLDIFGIVKNKDAKLGSPSLSFGIHHVAPREIRLAFDYRF